MQVDKSDLDRIVAGHGFTCNEVLHRRETPMKGTIFIRDHDGLDYMIKWFDPGYAHTRLDDADRIIRSATGLHQDYVLAYDDSGRHADFPFAILRYIKGKSADKILSSSGIGRGKAEILHRIGLMTARLHSMKNPGCTHLGSSEKGSVHSDTSYSDYVMTLMRNYLDVLAKDDVWRSAGMEQKLVSFMLSRREDLDSLKGSLVHGDLNFAHFITYRGDIAGIIDLEHVRFDFPGCDLYTIQYTEKYQEWSNLISLEPFRRGYCEGGGAEALEDFMKFEWLPIIRDVVGYAYHLSTNGQGQNMPMIIDALDRELKTYGR